MIFNDKIYLHLIDNKGKKINKIKITSSLCEDMEFILFIKEGTLDISFDIIRMRYLKTIDIFPPNKEQILIDIKNDILSNPKVNIYYTLVFVDDINDAQHHLSDKDFEKLKNIKNVIDKQ